MKDTFRSDRHLALSRAFPSCAADRCSQGRRDCPVPEACQVPEAPAKPRASNDATMLVGLVAILCSAAIAIGVALMAVRWLWKALVP